MRERLERALKSADADYAEIRIDETEGSSFSFRGKELDQSATAAFIGGVARACYKGGWGVVAFDAIDQLENKLKDACECARLVGFAKTTLADSPAVDMEIEVTLERDFRGIPLDQKIALVQKYNGILLKTDPLIESTSCGYFDDIRTVTFANSRGSYFREARPRVGVHFSAVAKKGAILQRSGDHAISATTYDCVLGLEEKAEQAAKRAVKLLSAAKVEGGRQTVVCDPVLAGVFVHEAFGHLSEADFLYENPNMRELMTIGRKMGKSELNIIDDGSMGHTIGSLMVDDEGTPTQKTYLIKEGILAGHLHSLETAAIMGAKPTGNARAVRRGLPPLVRMTNTYIDNGDVPVEELIAKVDHGIYAMDCYGGQTEFEQFTFSAGYGYRIENGQLGEMVRDVVLTGNVFETLGDIDGIGDDLSILQSPGGCGKGGQSPLPVTCSSPHLRIRNLLVGGTQE